MTGAVRVLATLVVVAVMAPLPALADVLPGGSVAGNAQGDYTSPGVGPTVTGLEWAVQHPQLGRNGSHATGLIRDAEGHIVLNAYEEQPDGTGLDVLVAIDPDDGSIAWQLDEMDSGCLPVASDDGFVYAYTTGGGGHTVTDGPGILEIDATDGSVARSWEEEVANNPADTTREDGNPPCGGGNLTSGHLTLVGDTLVFAQRRNFDRWLVAVDLSGADMTLLWEEYFDGWEGSQFPRVIASPEGDVVYYVHERGFSSDDPAVIGVFDVATGALLSTTDVTAIEHLAAIPGGLLAHDQSGPETLTRYDRVDDDLVEDWSVVWERDDATDESGTGGWIDELAVAGDTIVSAEPGGSPLYGISLETGLPVWTHRPTPSFINNGEPKVDANGVVWYSVFGFGLSAVDSATGDLVTTTGDDPDAFFGDFRGELIAPILDDGRVIMANTAFAAPDGVGLQLVAVSQGTARLEAETPDDVAIQICQLLFPAADTAGEILLSRNDAFPDALAGAPLAGDDACILYTAGGAGISLNTDTRAEIDRALPSGGRVNILGGVNAVSQEVEDELTAAGYEVVRFAGASRVETAVQIAVEVLRRNPGTSEALLATGNNFPDSVLGGAFGGAAGQPILLTVGDTLHPATAQLLADESITSTTALGGSAVVPDAAVAAAPGGSRLAGANRFATGALIASDLWPQVIGNPPASSRSFIVVDLSNARDGDAWTYALAAAPLSVRRGAPQIGVEPTRLPQETLDYLDAIGFSAPPGLIVVGGVAVVSETVVTQIQQGTS